MKLNLDFYSGKDLYSDGNTEKEILEYEKKYKENEFDKIFENDIRWPIFYHLTDIRKNILNWYPFNKDSEVLEIGAGMGAITGILCDKVKKVTAVELSKQRAQSIMNRCADKENLEIIVGNFNDIKFENKEFDYITLIGVFEYAALYTNTENPYIDFLNNIKTLLKPNGKLLIAIENKFGMKYWAGAPEDHTSIVYDGITGYSEQSKVKTFGKEEIKKILENSGFNNTKFYYPLPDYKLPTLIFSDEYLPDEKTIENYIPYYYEGTEIQFDEITAYKEVIKNNKFDFFANSFFIEASQQEINTDIDLRKIKLIQISQNAKKFYEKDYSKKDNLEEIKELTIKNEKLKEENDSLIRKIEGIEDSRAWKITKPLRSIMKKIKK